MKEILTRRGEIRELMRIYKVSEPTVINALRFRTHSELARDIRNTAMKRGGAEIRY